MPCLWEGMLQVQEAQSLQGILQKYPQNWSQSQGGAGSKSHKDMHKLEKDDNDRLCSLLMISRVVR